MQSLPTGTFFLCQSALYTIGYSDYLYSSAYIYCKEFTIMTRKKNGGCIQSIGTHNNEHLDTIHGAKGDTHCDGSLLHMKDVSSSSRDEKGESCTEEDSDKPEKTCRLLQLLSRLNWKNVITMLYLWAAYMLISMCFSLMTPFFPKEVDY